jgi:energy-coupling factor transporter ATP-binding protein EcfA2
MPAEGTPLLELRDWTLVQRRGDHALPLLSGLDLVLRPGSWVAVAGANGSGKSSLLTFLAQSGSPLACRSALLPQDPDDQFVAATVAGELALGRAPGPVAVPAGFGLDGLLDVDPRLLSAGQKQRLALAVALGQQPRVLLCDEPTALQDDDQAAWVLDRLDAWRRDGGGALVTATCDVREARRADELLILDQGRIAAAGPPGRVLADPAWARLFGIGAEGAAQPGSDPGRAKPLAGAAAPVLALRDVGCRFGHGEGFSGVDLELAPGDRLGLWGPNGCGKSTLLAACAGARRPDSGEISLGGRRLYARGALDLDHGRALLAPQFPEYLFSRSSVRQELSVDPLLRGRDAAAFLAGMGLPADLQERHPRDLSSGQKRRLALGLVLRSGRPLLLVDEPTVALDGPGRELVAALLRDLPIGTTAVVASHDRRFLAAIGCDVRRLGPVGLECS